MQIMTPSDFRKMTLQKKVTLYLIASSLISFLWYAARQQTLLYTDSFSHLMIAERIYVFGSWAQSGSTWLPLPHVIDAVFAPFEYMYQTGYGGSLISMCCFVATGIFLFKIVDYLFHDTFSSVAAMIVYGTNQDALYMQATPMTEFMLYLSLAVAYYYFLQWVDNDDRIGLLLISAIALFFGSLTRYESWFFLPFLFGVVMYHGFKQRWEVGKIYFHAQWFSIVAFLGGILWAIWNRIIFGSFTAFNSGQYSNAQQWIDKAEHNDNNVGKLKDSILTYYYGMVHMLTLPVLGLLLIGGLLWIYRFRSNSRTLSLLVLMIPMIIFPIMLDKGQRPMKVVELVGSYYNVRFALIMILAAVICVGLVVRELKRWFYPHLQVFVCILLLVNSVYSIHDRATLREGAVKSPRDIQQRVLAMCQKMIYDDKQYLMMHLGNETFEFAAQLPLSRVIYEGSLDQWNNALQNPRREHVVWIFVRTEYLNTDLVYQTVYPRLHSLGYVRVLKNTDAEVWRINDKATGRILWNFRMSPFRKNKSC